MQDEPKLSVEIAHAFGSQCGTQLRDAVLFGDDRGQYLIHPVGRHVAFRHVATNKASFAIESSRVEAVTACAVSRDRCHLAVCERCAPEQLTEVSVYDLNSSSTRPVIRLAELGAVGRLVSVAFSSDPLGTLLCVASASPELLLVVLDWRENVIAARCTLAAEANRVAISPLDSTVISASGPDFLQLWMVCDGELSPFPGAPGLCEAPTTFTDHVWLEPADGTLAACTAEGAIYIVSSTGDRIGSLSSRHLSGDLEGGAAAVSLPALHVLSTILEPFRAPVGGAQVQCIQCFPHGVVLGGSAGAVAVWERPRLAEAGATAAEAGLGAFDPTGEFQHICTAHAGSTRTSVCCIDVVGADAEMRVAVGFEDANIGCMSMASLRDCYSEEAPCDIIAGGFHSGPVTALDIAVQRPVFISACRQDCSVRVWNYATRTCELRWEFPGEEPTSVAIHPLGYFLAVSFSDRLRFMQILVQELKPHRELSIRGVRLVKFSNGGHLLAALQAKLVLVFNTRTLSKVAALRGHSQQVVALCFDPEDRALITCGEDGSLCEWSTHTWAKIHDHAARSSEAAAVAAGVDGHMCAGMVEGSRSFLRTFKHCAPLESADLELPDAMRLVALCHHTGPNGITVLAGTSSGMLWTCSAAAAVPMHPLHVGACAAVCLSADARTVVTAGDDGAIFVLRISGLVDSGQRDAIEARGDVVMINCGEIQARQGEIEQLSAEFAALRLQRTEDAMRLQSECAARVARARQKDQEEIQSLRLRFDAMQQAATAKERESLRIMKAMEASKVKAADHLEQGYTKKIRQETDRFCSLEAEVKELQIELDAMRRDSHLSLQVHAKRHEDEYWRRIAETDAEIQQLNDLLAFSQHRFDTMLDQEAMEHDLEVNDLTKKHSQNLEQQRLVEYKGKKEQDMLMRGLEMMDKDRERITVEQQETAAVCSTLKSEAEALQRTVSTLKVERREREASLRDKELEIGANKVKVNTLKKFKHVLDFRLREMTLSLQPKDRMIEQLNTQLRELEAEFERQLDAQKHMESNLDQKVQQISALTAESDRLRDIVKQRERTIFRFNTDLYALVNEEQDVRCWPHGVRKLYRDHVDHERISKDDGTPAMQELGRQLTGLQRKASSLGGRCTSMHTTCRADIVQKMDENSSLIQELDGLRVDQKVLNRQMKDLELRVRQAEHRLALARQRPAEPAALLDTEPGGGGAAAASPGTAHARPSSGPPAPRQRQAGRGLFGDKAEAQVREVQVRMPATAPLSGKPRKVSPSHLQLEGRKQIQRLLATADLNSQQIQMQKIEHKLLQDQLQKLLHERQGSDGGRAAAAAGAAAAPTRASGSAEAVPPASPPGAA